MPRPRKQRKLRRGHGPKVYCLYGSDPEPARSVVVFPDEMEALRLCDMEGLYQHEAAVHMGISRSAFQRTVAAARSKITQALVEGSTLQLKGIK